MLHYFMRLSEYAEVLAEVFEAKLTVVVDQYDCYVMASSPADALALHERRVNHWPCRQLYVGEQALPARVVMGDLQPARHGLVLMEAPMEVGKRLYLGACGYKSTWVDYEKKLQYTSPAPRRVYRRVDRILRRRLTFSMWLMQVAGKGQGAWPLNDRQCATGFSAGAEAWFREGGELMQKGVENSRYTPSKPQ